MGALGSSSTESTAASEDTAPGTVRFRAAFRFADFFAVPLTAAFLAGVFVAAFLLAAFFFAAFFFADFFLAAFFFAAFLVVFLAAAFFEAARLGETDADFFATAAKRLFLALRATRKGHAVDPC